MTLSPLFRHLGHLSQIFQTWPHKVMNSLSFLFQGLAHLGYSWLFTLTFPPLFFFVFCGRLVSFLEPSAYWDLLTVLNEIQPLMWLTQPLEKRRRGKKKKWKEESLRERRKETEKQVALGEAIVVSLAPMWEWGCAKNKLFLLLLLVPPHPTPTRLVLFQ